MFKPRSTFISISAHDPIVYRHPTTLRLLTNHHSMATVGNKLLLVIIFCIGIATVTDHVWAKETNTQHRAEVLTRALVGLNTQYQESDSSAQDVLIKRMSEIAISRQQAIEALLQDNPETILKVSLPEQIRNELPTALRKLVEYNIDIEGEIEIRYEDHEDGSHRLLYAIKSNGKHIPLLFDSKHSQVKSGKQVKISGLLVGSNPNHETDEAGALLVSASEDNIQYLAPSDSGTSSNTIQSDMINPVGEQRTLVLLLNFLDTSNVTPFTITEAQDVVFGTVADYFFEASYGQTWLTGNVRGWYTLPIASTCTSYEISDAADAAVSADGIDMSSYDRIIYIIKGAASCFWSGASNMGVYPSRAWINGNLNTKVIAHELGHGFGLHHSNFQDCGDTILGPNCTIAQDDKFDTMSASPEPAHFNAFQKERLGWFLQGDILSITSDGTYRIGPYEDRESPYPKALKIQKGIDPLSGSPEWYFIEYRQALGTDSYLAENWNVLNGVLIHTGQDSDGGSSRLLDMTPNSQLLTFNDRSDPALTVGNSYTDLSSGKTITTDWTDLTGATVTIDMGQQTCLHASPAITLQPLDNEWVAPGTPVSYNVTLINTDSSACTATSFALSSVTPDGWTAVFESNILTIDPGSSSATMLTVISDNMASEGFHDITVSAENSTDHAYTGSTTTAYVVNSNSVNQPPEAVNDSAITSNDASVTIAVLFNDTDPDGDQLSVSSVGQGLKGKASINTDGTITYTPAGRFKGSDEFIYTITDGLDISTATVTVSAKKTSGSKGGSGKGNGKNR